MDNSMEFAFRSFRRSAENRWEGSLQSAAILLTIVLALSPMADARPNRPDSGCEKALTEEAVRTLREYLAIDTTNPPGREMKTARFLQDILNREGIEYELIPLGNDRANLCARLRGSGRKRPVILLHHMDVVAAEPKFWKTPPFSGNVIDGYIYGRGAVDIKGKGVIDLMTMINLKRRKIPLDRDLIMLAVADEENSSIGAGYMVKCRPDLIREAEFLIDEGQCPRGDENGKAEACFVSIATKLPLWLTLTFQGPPGHGSVPLPDSSVNRLFRAANRLLARPVKLQVLPELREFIATHLAKADPALLSRIREGEPGSWNEPETVRRLARDPNIKAALCDTICITRLKGSEKVNSIPNEASLGIDCRLFPGTDPEQFINDIRKTVNDPDMEINIDEVPLNASTTLSPTDSDFMESLRRCMRELHPGIPVVPMILLSSTDSCYFRSLGIKCYGFEPYVLSEEEYGRAHGNDERLSVRNIEYGISLMTRLLTDLCGTHGSPASP